MSPVVARVLLTVLVGALCGVAVACAVVVLDRPDDVRLAVGRLAGAPAGPVPTGSAGAAAPAGAREVLRRWDAARARAWTDADAGALARLYTPGTTAGRRDVAMLRAWTARGVRLTALTTQVLRLRVVVRRERRLVVDVTDRVAYTASVAGTLPADRPTTRRVELVRPGDRWLVAAVGPAGPVGAVSERPGPW